MSLERIGQLYKKYVKEPLNRRNSPERVFRKIFRVDHTDPRAQERVLAKIEEYDKLSKNYKIDDEVGWDVGLDVRSVARRDLELAQASASEFGFMIARPSEEPSLLS